jgi:cell wall-associated NlpC family hydrolase
MRCLLLGRSRPALFVTVLLALVLSSCSSAPTRRTRNQSAGQDCPPITKADRQEILRLAQPNNFPKSRYKLRWNDRKPIEQETDCSKFVHEIYRRAGLPFPRATTKELGNLNQFVVVSPGRAKPGDLVVFPKHVGILNYDGKVISATQGGPRRRLATINNRDQRFRSSIVKSEKEDFSKQYYYLQYSCRPPVDNN